MKEKNEVIDDWHFWFLGAIICFFMAIMIGLQMYNMNEQYKTCDDLKSAGYETIDPSIGSNCKIKTSLGNIVVTQEWIAQHAKPIMKCDERWQN